ncbi:hypothetical protein ACFQ6C_26675 [Streptomyces sp. NPDC056454]|uniref:hypothetical protein n=1 Tax=Streptomyces sp. NPDC056454 TaxID=3345823 RepID=UPI0036B8AA5E
MSKPDLDLSGQPYWKDVDRTVMPTVEASLSGVRRVAVGWIGRLRAGVETYAPVPDVDQGGILELGQQQVRHLHAELGRQIRRWDTEPRDLIAEADTFLHDAGHLGRNRASQGYAVETDGTTVRVYHDTGRERDSHPLNLSNYARTLGAAGYTGPDGTGAPVVADASDDHAAHVVATPPAAESF